MCFTIRNGLQAKFGPKIGVVFSKNDTPLERKGPFTKLEELEREARQYGEFVSMRDRVAENDTRQQRGRAPSGQGHGQADRATDRNMREITKEKEGEREGEK